MRSTTFFVLALVTVFQVTRAIPIVAPPCGGLPAIPTLPLTPTSGVANSLADTLSLLTVSSLLADTLPYNYGVTLPGPYLPGPLPGPLPAPYLPGPLPAPYLPGPLPAPYLPEPYLPVTYVPDIYLPGPCQSGPYLPGPYLPGPYLPGCGCLGYPCNC